MLHRIHRALTPLIATLLLVLGTTTAAAQAPPLTFYGAQSGKETLDQSDGGGNPFASALIDVLARPSLRLGQLPSLLAQLTKAKSGGLQVVDGPAFALPKTWRLHAGPGGGRRVALVIVFSRYDPAQGAPQLPGAAGDATRVTDAFKAAGFDTQLVLDPDRDAYIAALEDFSRTSAKADASALYTTGHGVEVGGKIYLLPGNYPVKAGSSALESNAIPVASMIGTGKARSANLFFFAGCRNNPFGS